MLNLSKLLLSTPDSSNCRSREGCRHPSSQHQANPCPQASLSLTSPCGQVPKQIPCHTTLYFLLNCFNTRAHMSRSLETGSPCGIGVSVRTTYACTSQLVMLPRPGLFYNKRSLLCYHDRTYTCAMCLKITCSMIRDPQTVPVSPPHHHIRSMTERGHMAEGSSWRVINESVSESKVSDSRRSL